MPDNEQNRIITYSVVTLLIRLTIGILFFFAGLNKFIGGYGNFINWIIEDMTSKTWLPELMLYPYAYVLPFLEIAVGALLILGLWTRPVIAAAGFLMISLTFGKVLAKDYPTVANNSNYVLMTAIAFFFSQHNRYSLDSLLFGRKRE